MLFAHTPVAAPAVTAYLFVADIPLLCLNSFFIVSLNHCHSFCTALYISVCLFVNYFYIQRFDHQVLKAAYNF